MNQQCPSGTGFTVRCGTNYALLTHWGPRASPALLVAWGEEETRSTAEERPALTEPAFLSRAKGSPTMAAAAGFEPAHGSDPSTGFPNRPLQPLGYTTVWRFQSDLNRRSRICKPLSYQLGYGTAFWRRGWGSNPRAASLPHRRFQGDAVMTAPAPRRMVTPAGLEPTFAA